MRNMSKPFAGLTLAISIFAACGGVDVEAHTGVAASALCTIEDQQNGLCSLPTCASIGCPFESSGNGDMSGSWEPCLSDVCYCRSRDGRSLVACAP